MAMNLVKLENDLKNAPDQALVGYVQNPTGQVPTYLALAELERRKRMRQSAMASQGGEQPSVAEQLVSEAQPQMAGVASLPVENVGNEEAYAAGGIVAFEDGGSVQGYAAGDVVRLSPEEFARLSPEEQNAYLARQAQQNQAAMSGTGLFSLPRTTPAPAQAIEPSLAPMRITNLGQYALAPQYKNVSPEVVNKTVEQRKQAQPTDVPAPKQRQRDDVNAPPPPATAGITSLYQAPANPWADYTPEAATTAEAEMARMQGVLGVDPFRAKSQERLAAMEARAAQEEKVAPWMALAEAGFAMAGGDSPYALQNIGRGAQKGVESLAKAKERAAAAEEKRFGIESELARAQRAEQVAIAKYGFDSEQADKQRKQREELEKRKGTVDYETRVAENKFKDKQFQMEYKQRDREIGITAANARRQIDTLASNAEKEMRKAYLSSLDLQLKEINEALTAEQKSAMPNPDEISRLKGMFDQALAKVNEFTQQVAPATFTPSKAQQSAFDKYRPK